MSVFNCVYVGFFFVRNSQCVCVCVSMYGAEGTVCIST